MINLFAIVLITVIALNPHSEVGNIPDNWLLCKSKVIIAVRKPKEDGIAPTSLFVLKYTPTRPDTSPSDEGMLPDILL